MNAGGLRRRALCHALMFEQIAASAGRAGVARAEVAMAAEATTDYIDETQPLIFRFDRTRGEASGCVT